MFFGVTWIFYEWIQHPALHKHHGQAITKFQWNLLHGLRPYANLVKRFPLASFCDSKPVSHVCYCLNHNNRKSGFSKHCIKKCNDGYLLQQNCQCQLIYQVWSDRCLQIMLLLDVFTIFAIINLGKWLHSKKFHFIIRNLSFM